MAADSEETQLPAAAGPACVCGHARLAHQHYRRGTDCALCECRHFRRSRPLLDRLRDRLLGR